jgi:hypothetical protein
MNVWDAVFIPWRETKRGPSFTGYERCPSQKETHVLHIISDPENK